VLGQEREGHASAKRNLPHDAIAAGMMARPTGPVPDAETLDADWVTPFQNFDVGNPRTKIGCRDCRELL
jgi:hypothetical protein